MTDTHRKTTTAGPVVSERDLIDIELRRLEALINDGMQRVEKLAAWVKSDKTDVAAWPALTLEQVVDEYERLTHQVCSSIEKAVKLRQDRERKAAAAKRSAPRVERLVTQPYKRPTRH